MKDKLVTRSKSPAEKVGNGLNNALAFAREHDTEIATVVGIVPWGLLSIVHLPTGAVLTGMQLCAMFYSMKSLWK